MNDETKKITRCFGICWLLAAFAMAGCAPMPLVPTRQDLAHTPPPPAPAAPPVPVIQLRGSPTELGTQQGQQLRDAIVELHDQYLLKFIANGDNRFGSNRFAAIVAATLFENQLTPEYKAEIVALAAATHLPERDVVLGQCFLDLLPGTACSIVTLDGQASGDGVPRFGRNLDFPALGIADKHSVILVYHPSGQYSFAAVSWPGMIGVLSGMNEFGLCVANAEVPRGARWPSALPYTLLYRTVLEKCRTVDEAISLLQATPRQSANNLMLMDAAGDRAVAEITPEAVHIRRAPVTQPLMCTNTQRGDDQAPQLPDHRYDVLRDESALEFGTLSLQSIEQILDHASQGGFTLQSMVMEPSTKTMYLATGKQATTRPYIQYPLGRLMGVR